MASPEDLNITKCTEDPNFAVICSFFEHFSTLCGITQPTFVELQEMLEFDGEVPHQLVDLHVKLLRKAKKTVSTEKWERVLTKLCYSYAPEESWELETIGYKNLHLSTRLKLLRVLLDAQFDWNTKFKNDINKLSAEELRKLPLGRDIEGKTYWAQSDCVSDIRVYKEDLEEETWDIVAKDANSLINLINHLAEEQDPEYKPHSTKFQKPVAWVLEPPAKLTENIEVEKRSISTTDEAEKSSHTDQMSIENDFKNQDSSVLPKKITLSTFDVGYESKVHASSLNTVVSFSTNDKSALPASEEPLRKKVENPPENESLKTKINLKFSQFKPVLENGLLKSTNPSGQSLSEKIRTSPLIKKVETKLNPDSFRTFVNELNKASPDMKLDAILKSKLAQKLNSPLRPVENDQKEQNLVVDSVVLPANKKYENCTPDFEHPLGVRDAVEEIDTSAELQTANVTSDAPIVPHDTTDHVLVNSECNVIRDVSENNNETEGVEIKVENSLPEESDNKKSDAPAEIGAFTQDVSIHSEVSGNSMHITKNEDGVPLTTKMESAEMTPVDYTITRVNDEDHKVVSEPDISGVKRKLSADFDGVSPVMKKIKSESNDNDNKRKCETDDNVGESEVDESNECELGEAIEEPIMYTTGVGSGHDCDVGNPKNDMSEPENQSNIPDAEKVTSSYTITSATDKEKKTTLWTIDKICKNDETENEADQNTSLSANRLFKGTNSECTSYSNSNLVPQYPCFFGNLDTVNIPSFLDLQSSELVAGSDNAKTTSAENKMSDDERVVDKNAFIAEKSEKSITADYNPADVDNTVVLDKNTHDSIEKQSVDESFDHNIFPSDLSNRLTSDTYIEKNDLDVNSNSNVETGDDMSTSCRSYENADPDNKNDEFVSKSSEKIVANFSHDQSTLESLDRISEHDSDVVSNTNNVAKENKLHESNSVELGLEGNNEMTEIDVESGMKVQNIPKNRTQFKSLDNTYSAGVELSEPFFQKDCENTVQGNGEGIHAILHSQNENEVPLAANTSEKVIENSDLQEVTEGSPEKEMQQVATLNKTDTQICSNEHESYSETQGQIFKDGSNSYSLGDIAAEKLKDCDIQVESKNNNVLHSDTFLPQIEHEKNISSSLCSSQGSKMSQSTDEQVSVRCVSDIHEDVSISGTEEVENSDKLRGEDDQTITDLHKECLATVTNKNLNARVTITSDNDAEDFDDAFTIIYKQINKKSTLEVSDTIQHQNIQKNNEKPNDPRISDKTPDVMCDIVEELPIIEKKTEKGTEDILEPLVAENDFMLCKNQDTDCSAKNADTDRGEGSMIDISEVSEKVDITECHDTEKQNDVKESHEPNITDLSDHVTGKDSVGDSCIETTESTKSRGEVVNEVTCKTGTSEGVSQIPKTENDKDDTQDAMQDIGIEEEKTDTENRQESSEVTENVKSLQTSSKESCEDFRTQEEDGDLDTKEEKKNIEWATTCALESSKVTKNVELLETASDKVGDVDVTKKNGTSEVIDAKEEKKDTEEKLANYTATENEELLDTVKEEMCEDLDTLEKNALECSISSNAETNKLELTGQEKSMKSGEENFSLLGDDTAGTTSSHGSRNVLITTDNKTELKNKSDVGDSVRTEPEMSASIDSDSSADAKISGVLNIEQYNELGDSDVKSVEHVKMEVIEGSVLSEGIMTKESEQNVDKTVSADAQIEDTEGKSSEKLVESLAQNNMNDETSEVLVADSACESGAEKEDVSSFQVPHRAENVTNEKTGGKDKIKSVEGNVAMEKGPGQGKSLPGSKTPADSDDEKPPVLSPIVTDDETTCKGFYANENKEVPVLERSAAPSSDPFDLVESRLSAMFGESTSEETEDKKSPSVEEKSLPSKEEKSLPSVEEKILPSKEQESLPSKQEPQFVQKRPRGRPRKQRAAELLAEETASFVLRKPAAKYVPQESKKGRKTRKIREAKSKDMKVSSKTKKTAPMTKKVAKGKTAVTKGRPKKNKSKKVVSKKLKGKVKSKKRVKFEKPESEEESEDESSTEEEMTIKKQNTGDKRKKVLESSTDNSESETEKEKGEKSETDTKKYGKQKTKTPEKVKRSYKKNQNLEKAENKDKSPKSRLLYGLDISEESHSRGVRQSRRIAQLKIKQQVGSKYLDHISSSNQKTKSASPKTGKSEKNKKVETKTKKKKQPDSDAEVQMHVDTADSSKKRKKKKHDKAFFNLKNPWKSSSGSSSEEVEEEEEVYYEEEDEEELCFGARSDHEFSPESDLDDEDYVPVKKARTGHREVVKDDEKPVKDDLACRKCKSSDQPEWILLCDNCDSGWHASCLQPALLAIPEGDWFCPPCQHNKLIDGLHNLLRTYNAEKVRKENEEMRRRRLEYVGISLSNILPSNEKHAHKSPKPEKSSAEEFSEDSDIEPIYQLRVRKQTNIRSRLTEFDELINSAIQEDMEVGTAYPEPVPQPLVKPSVESSYLKLMENADTPKSPVTDPHIPQHKEEIDNTSEDKEIEQNGVLTNVVRNVEKNLIFAPRGLKKKPKKLTQLDLSSEEEDRYSDEDFKQSSAEDEDEEEYVQGETDSDEIGYRRSKRVEPTRRSTRARTIRYDNDFIDDESEEDNEPQKKKKSRKLWNETDSEEDDLTWGKRKRNRYSSPWNRRQKRKRLAFDESDEESKGRKSKSKRRRIVYGLEGNDSDAPLPRTRGKKINYLELAGSDSDTGTDSKARGVKRQSEDDEYVQEEFEEEEDDEYLEKDENTGSVAELCVGEDMKESSSFNKENEESENTNNQPEKCTKLEDSDKMSIDAESSSLEAPSFGLSLASKGIKTYSRKMPITTVPSMHTIGSTDNKEPSASTSAAVISTKKKKKKKQQQQEQKSKKSQKANAPIYSGIVKDNKLVLKKVDTETKLEKKQDSTIKSDPPDVPEEIPPLAPISCSTIEPASSTENSTTLSAQPSTDSCTTSSVTSVSYVPNLTTTLDYSKTRQPMKIPYPLFRFPFPGCEIPQIRAEVKTENTDKDHAPQSEKLIPNAPALPTPYVMSQSAFMPSKQVIDTAMIQTSPARLSTGVNSEESPKRRGRGRGKKQLEYERIRMELEAQKGQSASAGYNVNIGNSPPGSVPNFQQVSPSQMRGSPGNVAKRVKVTPVRTGEIFMPHSVLAPQEATRVVSGASSKSPCPSQMSQNESEMRTAEVGSPLQKPHTNQMGSKVSIKVEKEEEEEDQSEPLKSMDAAVIKPSDNASTSQLSKDSVKKEIPSEIKEEQDKEKSSQATEVQRNLYVSPLHVIRHQNTYQNVRPMQFHPQSGAQFGLTPLRFIPKLSTSSGRQEIVANESAATENVHLIRPTESVSMLAQRELRPTYVPQPRVPSNLIYPPVQQQHIQPYVSQQQQSRLNTTQNQTIEPKSTESSKPEQSAQRTKIKLELSEEESSTEQKEIPVSVNTSVTTSVSTSQHHVKPVATSNVPQFHTSGSAVASPSSRSLVYTSVPTVSGVPHYVPNSSTQVTSHYNVTRPSLIPLSATVASTPGTGHPHVSQQPLPSPYPGSYPPPRPYYSQPQYPPQPQYGPTYPVRGVHPRLPQTVPASSQNYSSPVPGQNFPYPPYSASSAVPASTSSPSSTRYYIPSTERQEQQQRQHQQQQVQMPSLSESCKEEPEETGEFGGLVSYFSSQQTDDMEG